MDVLGTAELFDHIMEHLHPRDIFNFMQTNRGADDAVCNSTRVQRDLALQPDPAGDFHSYFTEGAESMGPQIALQNLVLESTEIAHLNFHVRLRRLDGVQLSVGKRCRSMLICQPPIKELNIRSSDIEHWDHNWSEATVLVDGYAPRSISSESGITVGHVLDLFDELFTAKAFRPYARGFALGVQSVYGNAELFEVMWITLARGSGHFRAFLEPESRRVIYSTYDHEPES